MAVRFRLQTPPRKACPPLYEDAGETLLRKSRFEQRLRQAKAGPTSRARHYPEFSDDKDAGGLDALGAEQHGRLSWGGRSRHGDILRPLPWSLKEQANDAQICGCPGKNGSRIIASLTLGVVLACGGAITGCGSSGGSGPNEEDSGIDGGDGGDAGKLADAGDAGDSGKVSDAASDAEADAAVDASRSTTEGLDSGKVDAGDAAV